MVILRNIQEYGKLANLTLPNFKIVIICESFKGFPSTYVKIYVSANEGNNLPKNNTNKNDEMWRIQEGVQKNTMVGGAHQYSTLFLIEQIVRSLAHLKVYIPLHEAESFEVPKSQALNELLKPKPKILVNHHKFQKSWKPSKNKYKFSEEEVRLEATERATEIKKRCKWGDNSPGTSDDTDDTLEVSTENTPKVVRASKGKFKGGQAQKFETYQETIEVTEEDKVEFEQIQTEIEVVEETEKSEQEYLVEKCFQNGKWTKWVPERCNSEEKQIFENTKAKLVSHFEKTDPEVLQRDINDNLILRFLAADDFTIPDSSFERILEYADYIKEHDYYNLTKEGIIEQAEGEHKKVFDWGVHTLGGKDREGRPILILKVSNIDKNVFADLKTSRLYMLYQVSFISELIIIAQKCVW